MNSGDLKTYKYEKISKSNFFTTSILSLHSICSESNNKVSKDHETFELFSHILEMEKMAFAVPFENNNM